ncbi:MAG TPA: hypothetical protein PLP02_03045 [Bacillota bacterium]|nr:hypothetical protein [Bacillota bacterium]HPF42461.1 hypothetical protein [Bacillota bacterium]
MKRRYFALLLFLLFGMFMVACGNDTLPTTNLTSNTTSATTLTTGSTTVSTTASTTASTTTTVYTGETVTVRFLDGNDVLISEVVIHKGASVVPPTPPTKAATTYYSYVFSGWDHALTNVNEDTTIRAQFVATYLFTTGTFNHADLLTLIRNLTDDTASSDAEIEAKIAMIMTMIGISSEEHLYDLLSEVPDLMTSFQAITSSSEFATWYAQLKAAGFNKELITDTAINLIRNGVGMWIENYDPEDFADEILGYQNQISVNEAAITDIQTAVNLYCTLYTSDPANCQLLFSYILDDFYNYINYDNMYYSYFYSVDWEYSDEYYNLQNYMDSYIYFSYQEGMETEAANALSEYNNYYSSLTEYQQNAFDPIIDAFSTYSEHYWAYTTPLTNDLSGLTDTQYGENVVQYLYSQEQSIENLYWTNHSLYQDIANVQDEMVRMEEQFMMFQTLQQYLQTQDGLDNLKILVIAFYDSLDAIATAPNADLFNLITTLISEGEEFDPSTITTSDALAYLVGLVDMMEIVQTNMLSTASLANIIEIAEDLMPQFINNMDDLTSVEKAALIATITPKITQYVNMFASEYDNVLTFLDSMNFVKGEAVMDFVAFMSEYDEQNDTQIGGEYPVHMIYQVSVLVNTLIGDDSFDVSQLLSDLIVVYYDIDTEFQAVPSEVTDTQAAATANVERIIVLAGIIAAGDPDNLSPTQMASYVEIGIRVQAFITMFSDGFETALEPIVTTYVHGALVEAITHMFDVSETEAEGIITDMLVIMGFEDEEDMYYFFVSVATHAQEMEIGINNYTDLESWINWFYDMGYTKEEIADIVYEMAVYVIDLRIATGGILENDIAYYENQILVYEGLIVDANAAIDSLSGEFTGMLGMASPEEVDLFMNFWTLQKEKSMREYTIMYMEYDVDYEYFDWGTYDGLKTYLYEDYIGTPGAMDSYNSMFYSLSPDEQAAYQPLMDQWMAYYDFLPTYESSQSEVSSTSNLTDAYIFVMNNLQYSYENQLSNIFSYESQITWMTEKIDDLNGQMELLTVLSEYLANTADGKDELVKNVIMIALDEVENLLSATDDATIDMFIALIQNLSGMPDNGFDPATISASDIYNYTQEAANILTTLLATIDSTDQANIRAFVLDALEIKWTAEGEMTPTEISDQLTIIGSTFDKYYPRLVTILGMLSTALIQLDTTEIGDIMDTAGNIAGYDNSIAMMIVYVSEIADIFLTDTPTALDYTTLVDYAVDAYFDITYDFNYTGEVNIADLQDVYEQYAASIAAYFHLIAAMDPDNLTTDNVKLIFSSYLYVRGLVGEIEEGGFETMTYTAPDMMYPYYTYDYQDFYDLVDDMIGGDMTETEINDWISDYVTDSGLTAEEAMYQLFMNGLGEPTE